MTEDKKAKSLFESHLNQLSRSNTPLFFTLITHPCCNFIQNLNIHTNSINSTEIDEKNIHQYFRLAVKAKLREFKRVYEGEVTSFSLYNKIFTFTLRSCKGSHTLKLSSAMYNRVKEEKISIGDVVYIEPLVNAIRKVGRCESSFEYDIEMGKKVALPKDEVLRNKLVLQNVTLFDLDCTRQSEDIIDILGSENETDDLVTNYVEKGLGEIETGILHIKDVHLLKREILQMIVSLFENNRYVPILILSTDSKEYVREMKDVLGDCLVVQFKSGDENVFGERNVDIKDELEKFAGRKGVGVALNLIESCVDLSKDDLKSIEENCYFD